jgi:AcrR family transcriptional regulator
LSPTQRSRGTSSDESGKAAPERSRELVDVAARLFRERGYDATSMQTIADEMGILKGSVYHYVRTKEDLLWMVVEPPLRQLTESVRKILTDADRSFDQRIRDAMAMHAHSFELNYPHMHVITLENGETLSDPRRGDFEAMRHEYFKIWRTAVSDGQSSGEVRAELDVRTTVQAIFGMLNWMSRWFVPGRKAKARDVSDTFAEIFLKGVAPTRKAAARGKRSGT